MDIEWLGWTDATPVGEADSVQAPVYVAWCAMPITAVEIAGTVCPHCGMPLDLTREGGVLEQLQPTTVSVSESCAACHAIVHFDAAPREVRQTRTWPAVAVTSREKQEE